MGEGSDGRSEDLKERVEIFRLVIVVRSMSVDRSEVTREFAALAEMLLGNNVAVHATEEVVLADFEEVAGCVPFAMFGAGVTLEALDDLLGLVAFFIGRLVVDGFGGGEVTITLGADVGGFLDVPDIWGLGFCGGKIGFWCRCLVMFTIVVLDNDQVGALGRRWDFTATPELRSKKDMIGLERPVLEFQTAVEVGK